VSIIIKRVSTNYMLFMFDEEVLIGVLWQDSIEKLPITFCLSN
jgi:hypothetical protein